VSRSTGITLKSRSSYDQNKAKRCIPGPASYNTITSLISPSFNVNAKASIDRHEDVLESYHRPSIISREHESTSPPHRQPSFARPSRPSSHPQRSVPTSENKSQRHRLIFDAQSLRSDKADHNGSSLRNHSTIPGGAYHAPLHPPPSQPTAQETISREQTQENNHSSQQPHPLSTGVRPSTRVKAADPSPAIHLTKDDVKSARRLFQGILHTTEQILTKQSNEQMTG
jgi:hypothetical protein